MDILSRLFELQDTAYRDFQSKLTPSVAPELFIGVRTPILRSLAKELKGSPEADTFLHTLPHKYYEENNLHSFLICLIKDYDKAIEETDRFLPYVDNWATCDQMSPAIFKKHREKLYIKTAEWLASGKTYTIRFGIEMLMSHFLDESFQPSVLERVAQIRSEEYYVNMMIAWFFATALAKQYYPALPYIVEHRLDTWTHNKAIQKAIESNRITPEQKEYLRTLKLRR